MNVMHKLRKYFLYGYFSGYSYPPGVGLAAYLLLGVR
jgi:hypothetical protein